MPMYISKHLQIFRREARPGVLGAERYRTDSLLHKIGQLIVRPMLCTKSHKAPEWGADKTRLFSFIIACLTII